MERRRKAKGDSAYLGHVQYRGDVTRYPQECHSLFGAEPVIDFKKKEEKDHQRRKREDKISV